MKLSMCFLSVLLALSSAALQDIQGNRSQTTEGLEDTVEPPSNRSLLVLLTPAELQGNRTGRSSVRYQSSTLTWQTYNGYVPSGAYFTFVSYTGRTDYVCKYRCFSGFFSPRLGPYCHYPLAGRERRGFPFQLLVNKGSFEILEWKAGSRGVVPKHSVQTCYGGDFYVGRNKYGLGNVQPKRKYFFLPWKGREYRYSGYEVLTVNKNYDSEQMYEVNYDLDVTATEHPPQVIRQSTLINSGCSPVEKTVELSETFQEEKRWDIRTSVTFLKSITASIPIIGGSEITLGLETSFEFSRGTSVVESKTYSVSIEKEVPPNHSCYIMMMGRKYQAEIPFTAKLSRKYNNGQTRVKTITGTFRGVNMGSIQSVVEPCRPVHNPTPCPTTKT